jgi:excisionase family DNA binding protein
MDMLVSIKEAANYLSLSPSHIRKMIARGRFPSYRMGSRIIRVDPDEIRSATKTSQAAERELTPPESTFTIEGLRRNG